MRAACSPPRGGEHRSAQRAPGLVAGDVDEVVPAFAERRPDHDLELRRLVPVVEGRVHDARVDVDGVAGGKGGGLPLEVLGDASLLDDDHLFLTVVTMERMPFSRLERHVHYDDALRPRVGWAAAPADRAPVELLLLDIDLFDERAHRNSS